MDARHCVLHLGLGDVGSHCWLDFRTKDAERRRKHVTGFQHHLVSGHSRRDRVEERRAEERADGVVRPQGHRAQQVAEVRIDEHPLLATSQLQVNSRIDFIVDSCSVAVTALKDVYRQTIPPEPRGVRNSDVEALNKAHRSLGGARVFWSLYSAADMLQYTKPPDSRASGRRTETCSSALHGRTCSSQRLNKSDQGCRVKCTRLR